MDRALRQARQAYGRLYLWAAERLYHEFASLYDAVSWLVSGGRWARWRSMALDYVQGPVVVEVGFGTGELLREMAGRGWQVVGVDASGAMQRVTARKLRRQSGAPRRVQARVQALPLGDASCDAIVSTFPAPYIVDPASLAECARVLGPGGRLVIVGLVIYREKRSPGLQFQLRPPGEPGVDLLCALAESAGLDVRRISRMDPPVRLPILIAERRT
jgi:SAM-dependent methyltransferase